MENFQLYRTNILLGGQMKLDLILDPVGDKLSVTDMHLSPISPHAPYPKYSDENLLNYKHQDNIKMFYKNTEGTFFDSCINPDLKHDWVLLDNDRAGEKVAEYNLDAGPKCGQYSVYGKSIELFCPVWLEHVTDDMRINIVIESKGKKVASRFVTFEGVFKKYLYEYFQYVGLLDGCDDVISVDFGEKQAYVSGISLTSGNIVKQDISNIIYNLLYRERPLMEVDSMLINHFKNNHLISRQLFNFNLCFNLSDMLSEYLTSFMYGNLINIKAEVYIGDNKLEVRDFYSNYEYISKSDTTTYSVSDVINDNTSDTKHNVLDYLRDYQYTEFINKNKYVQNIIHWSLLDNSDYIFNLYNGFGGYMNVNEGGENKTYYYSHNYGKSPELLNAKYSIQANNLGWCSNYKITNSDEWNSIISLNNDTKYHKLKLKTTDFQKKWVNDIRYNEGQPFKGPGAEWSHYYCAIFIYDASVEGDIVSSINSGIFVDYIDMGNGVYYARLKNEDDFVCFLSGEAGLDDLTFAGIKNKLKAMGSSINNHPLGFLRHKLSLAEVDDLISIDKSLYLVSADSPNLVSTEIDYYKNDNKDLSYVLRYDGKIKPTFIKSDKNYRYYKPVYGENTYKKLDYAKYIRSGFIPKYPSIGFCAWEKEDDKHAKYFGDIPVLIREISTTFDLKKGEDVSPYIKEYLKQKYPHTSNPIQYYNVNYSYDYKSLTDIDNYTYKVNMILK